MSRHDLGVFDRFVACAASMATRSEPPRLFTEVGRHPRLFRTWLPFAGTLLFRGALPRADSELVVLRTAWSCGCDYEWAHHVRLGMQAGLSEAQILAVPDGEAGTPWSWRQQVLLRAADELHGERRITPPTNALIEHVLSDRELVELCMLVGHYEMLAMLLRTRGTEPEPRLVDRLPAAAVEIGTARRAAMAASVGP